ncbi:MAG: leucine-rich repeat domain-containing protein [Clostridia bacterium]|nr:leucine-rich repeat domain-containing protein [Clostridia bacterium]
MSKFSLKKLIATALSVTAVATLSAGAAGCVHKSTDLTEPDNIEITRLAPPDDGSLPTAHTCAENLAYIVYVFDSQEQYHSYSYGVTAASIATQTTRNFRDYKDGVLLTTDLTYSSMVKSGTQTCTVQNADGEYEVYFRTSEAPQADTLPSEAVWSEEAPVIFNERSYHYTYGLLPNELFNYIVNENNIIDSEQIKVNADGTYTQSFTLDPVASTYFYQFGMKTRGGLSGYPEFQSITFSVTFDGGWKILSASMHEVANVNKGIVVSSVSDFATEYWYGDDHFDDAHYAYYDSYYKKYLGDDSLEQGGSTDEKLVVDVTNVLSNGFSQIMNGGAQFEITANLGNNTYVGYAFVSLDLSDPLGTLVLNLSLGKSLKEQTLYIEYEDGEIAAYYGKDFALNGNLAEVKLAVGQFGDVIDKITAAFGKNGDQDQTTDTQTAEEGVDPISELMNAMVITAGEKQAVLTLDTDDLLGLGIGIDARLVFGINNNEITFRGGSVGGLSIGGETVDLGLTILTTTAPRITRPSEEEGANLAEYIADVHSLLGADLIKVKANLRGDDEKVKIAGLKGVNADVTAYVDIDDITVGADADVSYTYLGHKISATVGVWYGYDPASDGYGKAVVSLKQLNGVPVNINLKCDIKEVAEAVTQLLTLPEAQSASGDGLIKIVNGALSADFSGLLTEVYADKASIKIGVSVDALLEMFNVNAGLKFGSCTLKYQRGEGVYGGSLSASLPALGFDMSVSGADGAIEQPDFDSCLDLTDLINTAGAVWSEVESVIEEQSIAFEIERGTSYLSLDGIVVDIWGEGEISWKKGGEYVALDLAMAITEKASDVATFKLIYDKNADGTPLVKMALNEVGLEIYKEDIDSVKAGFNDIYNKVKGLFGADTQTAALTVEENDDVSGNDKLMSALFGLLASDKWVSVLNDLTLTSDGKSVALKYLSENAASVEIGADGALTLNYEAAIGERFTMGGGVTATSVTGSLIPAIESKFESCNMSSSKDGSAGFVRLAYDFLFEAISSVSVENILGSSTYAVQFGLNGDNCNIEGLENVYVGAEIYVTGEKGEQGKLAEANLDIDAAGVIIKLNVITERRGNNTHFYINLSQVADIKLPDLKMVATQDSLFKTFEVLFDTLNNTNVLEVLGKLLATDGSTETAEGGENSVVITDDTKTKLASLLTNILEFNFSEAVVATETEGVLTATIDLDNVVSQLGFNTGKLGTVEAVINHNSHSMKTSGKTFVADADGNEELKEWIYLSSELTARRDYSKFERADYISIEFLPTLIQDIVKVATNNGELRTQYTLSGSITAKIVNMLDVNIDTITVTAGIDGENGLVLNAVMHVKETKVLGMGIAEGTAGITYRNGLLTLARGLNTSTPEYKIMTFDYFMDHMLSKNSVLEWLFRISGWDLIMSFVKADVSSGLTTTQDVYLYNKTEQKTEQEISMYDFVDALRVMTDGRETAVFGNYSALESDLGVYDNYYGFALNAGTVTNGVLTKLNAAITRTDAGLDSVKASGAIQSYVTFNANLKFNCDWSDEYATGTTLQSGKTAPDLYGKAMAEAEKANELPDFEYTAKKPEQGYDQKFGCFSVTSGNNGYTFTTEYSNVLYSHKLTVVGLNGEKQEMEVRHGSTVYLYDNDSPVYADAAKTDRLLYTTGDNGELSGTQFIMNGDTVVYATTAKSVTVVVHNGSEEHIVNSFVGDKVPVSVTGLETVQVPTYEDGTPVGADDVIDGTQTTLHIYGTFVKSETVINFVKYTFNASTLSYTASGKAAGFNDYYSVKGNTLVLENVIGGYPVTAIAANAFANTEGKPIKSVVVPENIVTVGENAFLDNLDMESAVFLAENVTFLGKDGNSKTMPFYGCSVSSNEEKTALTVYYNNIVANGGNWKHFRYVSKVFSFNFYIGDNGGAAYSKGGWQYVDYNVNVDLNGVVGSTLTTEAVENILSGYFPYVTAGAYAGSAYETTVNKALQAGLANMSFTRDGITYMCDYTVTSATENGKTALTFNVTYKKTAEIYVYSELAFSMFGTDIAANTLTKMNVPMDGDDINLPEPTHATHNFKGWTKSEEDGKLIYTASWLKKNTYTITVNIKKGFSDNNNIYLNGVNLGQNKTPEIKVYEGSVSISVDSNANRIYITDSANTYYIEVKELSLKGFKYAESGKLRSVTTGDIGDKTISTDTTITVSY